MLINLANQMAEAGIETHLVLCQARGILAEQVSAAVQVVDLDVGSTLAALPGFMRVLRALQPDAVLTAPPDINLVALWAVRLSGVKTRLIVSERNHLTSIVRSSNRLRIRLRPWLEKQFYPWADAIVAISQGVADDLSLSADIPKSRIRVIYNPVVSSDLIAQSQEAVDHPWFAPGSPPVILAAGRLHPQKDYPTLLHAFDRLRKRRTARLLILGEGEERTMLERLVNQLGLEELVSLPGSVSNPFRFMSRAAVFVLSSAWEGFGNVLVEAMACGTPVVSTDCPSGPAEILENGRYGQLVAVGDSVAMAAAIGAALDSPLPPDVLRARAQQFSVENSLKSYCETLGLRLY